MTLSKKNRIKVAMIIQDYLPRLGGAEKQLAALAPLLKERGIDIFILTRRYPGLAQFEIIEGVPVYRLPILRNKVLASLIYTITALPILYKLRPDVIHAHGLLSPTTIAVLANRLFGTPVVSKSLRGGVLGDLIRLIDKPFGRTRFNMLQKHVDMFITISNEIRQELVENGVPQEQCIFIPNGVDLGRFHPISKELKSAIRKELDLPLEPLAIFVGRLEKEKRIEQLIQIWPEVRKQYTDANLLILGTGAQEEYLKRIAGKGIKFCGFIEDIVPYAQSSDLFVLPSISEGLSNALLEALAMGLPVVATATGGTTDVVQHKISGWLIRNYNSTNLIEGITAFLGNKSFSESCANKGQRIIREKYSVVNTADNLCKLYNDLLFEQRS